MTLNLKVIKKMLTELSPQMVEALWRNSPMQSSQQTAVNGKAKMLTRRQVFMVMWNIIALSCCPLCQFWPLVPPLMKDVLCVAR